MQEIITKYALLSLQVLDLPHTTLIIMAFTLHDNTYIGAWPQVNTTTRDPYVSSGVPYFQVLKRVEKSHYT